MTNTNPSRALQVAQAYHRAWTSGDLDAAMALVADDIRWRVPDGELTGKQACREYLGGFLQVFTGSTDIAAYGDDEHAVLLYYPETAATKTTPAAEHFTVRDGKIVDNQLMFDRLSYGPPQ